MRSARTQGRALDPRGAAGSPRPCPRPLPGGDNSDSAIGTFFEGCMTAGYSTDVVDNEVFENVKEAGYGGM